ncbi:hypothetical protein [Halegenticoccus tardaugens]|uniref:hypothetical protein n=1 Tax=Halegenticoccus tardaugens TaxID=2071624 RepID=UPI00100B981F|nr:hypothetical protein [Halegenticoccus tardaugens]
MTDDFDAFNEQVETNPQTEDPPSDRGEIPSTRFEAQVTDVEVVGEDDDRLKVSAETPEEKRADRELDVDEAGRIMSQLDITDARALDGQPVFVWEDDGGSTHLEFDVENLE